MEVTLMIEGQEDVTWEDWVAIARACEDSGVGTLFRSDHYLSVEDRRERGSLDALTTLAGLAAITEKLRLGTMVSPATFRHPSVFAKSIVTIDQISGGRVEPGLGAGWWDREHEAYGFDLPELGPRHGRLRRAARGDHQAVGGRRLQLRRRALQGRRPRRAAEAGAAAAAAVHHRRLRRAAQPAHRRQVGRRVQHGLRRAGEACRDPRRSSTPPARSRAATRRPCRSR